MHWKDWSRSSNSLATWCEDRLTGKDPDAGKDWKWEERGTTEDAMVGWHHWLDRHESEQAPGVGDEQGSLACCSPWGHKELDTTERLNWTDPDILLLALFLISSKDILSGVFRFIVINFNLILYVKLSSEGYISLSIIPLATQEHSLSIKKAS